MPPRELRITWADLELRGACAPSRAAFFANVERQAHGIPETLVYADGWTQANTDRCMSLPGGPEFLTFLEFYGLVPVLRTDSAAFKHPATKSRRVAIGRNLGADGYAHVPSAGAGAAGVAAGLAGLFAADVATALGAGLAAVSGA